MNLSHRSDDDSNAEALVEQAIAEFLIAEDRQSDFQIEEWLDRYASVRSRLEAFLRDHRRTLAAFHGEPPAQDSRANSGLHETLDFNSLGVASAGSPIRDRDVGTRIGRYQIVRLLGSGGMGRVYEAIDEQGYRFAIKVIAGHMSSTPETIERFKQEGIVASTINHPHCVFVHEADTVDGHPYIAMELMPGTTLRDLVQEKGPLSVREAIEKIIDVIDGLQAAHACKLIHRDVKPSNCYLDATGRVKVGDFGLAKSLDSDLGLTMTGSIVGTPLFASPEQMRGETLDPRTDVYSVCATLYYLLTGKAPFENSNATIVIARALSEEVSSIRELRSEIPESLDRLLRSGMSRNRELRPKDMQQLRSKLVEYLPQQRPVAGLGLRFSAYCVDVLLLSVFVGIAAALRPEWFAHDKDLASRLRLETHFFASFLQGAYFFGCEWWFRTTLGKSFMGLRVQVDPPMDGKPLLPILTRVIVWWLFTGILSDSLLVLMGLPLSISLQNPWQWFGYVASNLLLCVPLLWRKDGRLLHDLASSTHVASVKTDEGVDEDLTFQLEGLPSIPVTTSFGRFAVHRILHESSDCTWYEGTDPGLERLVWIAARPSNALELTEERRCLSTPGQPRWIGGGCTNQHRWDAFLGLESIALTQLNPCQHGMSDKRAKKAFSELVTEFARLESSQQLSLSTLDIERYRIGLRGSLVRLDDLNHSPNDPAELESKTVLSKLKLFCHTLFGIEGDTRSRRSGPMALHLTKILDRIDPSHSKAFPTMKALSEELHTTQSRPVVSSFRIRFIQIATQAALSLAPLGAMLAMVGSGHLLRLDRIENELLRLYALQEIRSGDDSEASWKAIQESPLSLHEGALSPSSITGDLLEQEIATFEMMQETARERISGIDRQTLDAAHEVFVGADLRPWLIATNDLPNSGIFQWALPSELPARFFPKDRSDLDALVSVNQPTEEEFRSSGKIDTEELAISLARMQASPGALALTKTYRVVMVALFPWVSLAIWGFLWRGGISRLTAGLVIVDKSGKPAGWLRILLRSALLWAPQGILLASTILLEFYGLTSPEISSLLRTCCVGFPVVYLAIGLLSQRRGLHDSLSGTWLVPR
jgi:hypothetical protein